MFDCHLVESYGQKKRQKKGSNFGVPVPVINGIWGCLQRGGPPCDPKSNNLMQKSGQKRFPSLLTWKPKMSSKDMPSWPSPKKLAWHMQTYSTIKLKIIFLLCTPMILIYNSELGMVISSDFSTQRNSRRSIIYSLVTA